MAILFVLPEILQLKMHSLLHAFSTTWPDKNRNIPPLYSTYMCLVRWTGNLENRKHNINTGNSPDSNNIFSYGYGLKLSPYKNIYFCRESIHYLLSSPVRSPKLKNHDRVKDPGFNNCYLTWISYLKFFCILQFCHHPTILLPSMPGLKCTRRKVNKHITQMSQPLTNHQVARRRKVQLKFS